MKKIIIITIISSFIGVIGFSFTNCGSGGRNKVFKTQLDVELDAIIAANSLTPLTAPPAESAATVALGRALFNETALSGPNDISCATCHSDALATGDGLPFAIGTGATGAFPNRKQVNGQSNATSRHSPSIFNKVRPEQMHAVWDGRIQMINGNPSTPVADISGPTPARADIASVLTNAYDIQPLFPILSPTEMLGSGNSLASQPSEVDVWDAVLQNRLLNQPSYVQMFSDAFPNVATNNLSPGHIGRAIGAFMRTKFFVNNTPFDRYVAGDIVALNESQKQGMKVFYTKGACNSCHTGIKLSGDQFDSSGTPQIGFSPFLDDLGRREATNDPVDDYKFKVPSLRNVGLSAPFMHNGAFETLEAVVNHYNDVVDSLTNYSIPASYQSHYEKSLVLDNSSARDNLRIQAISEVRVRNGLNLTDAEKQNLVDFLRNGLTDESFKQR